MMKTTSALASLANNQLLAVLVFGILLRTVVFAYQSPFNLDSHLEIVAYIFTNHAIPLSQTSSQSDHPPLYYVLATPLYPYGPKAVQSLSLAFSISTLYVLYLLIRDLDLIRPAYVKTHCLLLAGTLPQFVMIGNYISNDSLAFFLGSLLYLTLHTYIKAPNMVNLCKMAACMGVGLLTKGTFLTFIPALALVIVTLARQEKRSGMQTLESLMIFACIFLALGSYKGIQNMAHFNRPLVMNNELEPGWMAYQRPVYTGLNTIYDVNILTLWGEPTLSEQSKHSYPLLFYASFWYQHVTESNFTGNTRGYGVIGSMIYMLAMVPTLLFICGFITILISPLKWLTSWQQDRQAFNQALYEKTALFLLVSTFIPVMHLAIKYDIWSWVNSRYFFPSFFAFILFFNAGLRTIRGAQPALEKTALLLMAPLYLLFIAYFIAEIALISKLI